MRTMGAGCACWLSSSWRSTERQEESGGGWGDCNCATTFSPKFDARLGQRRRAAISATQKRVGLLSSSSSESQATCVFCRPTGYATRYEQASSKGEKAPLTPVRTKGKKEKEKRKSITPGKKCPLSGKEG